MVQSKLNKLQQTVSKADEVKGSYKITYKNIQHTKYRKVFVLDKDITC